MRFTLNGRPRDIEVEPDMPLLWALRDVLGQTDTKYGCGAAQCGACTVFVEGAPARACQTLMEAVEGRTITTFDGTRGPVAEAVKAAWTRLAVGQCGYCQSGQMMSAIALLTENKRPTDVDIDAAMSGNLCRCATYQRIRAAIHDAARTLG